MYSFIFGFFFGKSKIIIQCMDTFCIFVFFCLSFFPSHVSLVNRRTVRSTHSFFSFFSLPGELFNHFVFFFLFLMAHLHPHSTVHVFYLFFYFCSSYFFLLQRKFLFLSVSIYFVCTNKLNINHMIFNKQIIFHSVLIFFFFVVWDSAFASSATAAAAIVMLRFVIVYLCKRHSYIINSWK